MTVLEARTLVKQFGRNTGGDSSNYAAADVDRAVQFVGNHFCRETRALKTVSDVALTSGSAAASFTALTGFRPERLIAAWLSDGPAEDNPGLELVDWDTLWRLTKQGTTASGVPQQLAFSDWTTAQVYPTPGAAYTMKVRWTPPFTTWTAGSNDSTVLNLPDDWLLEILPYGPPAVLQHNEVEHRYASESWKKYLEIVERIRGEGGLGVRQSSRAAVGGVGGYRYGGGMYGEGQREVP